VAELKLRQFSYTYIALALCPSCVPENVSQNKKLYSQQKQALSVIKCHQPKGVKPKKRDCKLRCRVNWQAALKVKILKLRGVKQGLGVFDVLDFTLM
jgi:hypothetical protein